LRRLYVADLHLADAAAPQFLALAALLEQSRSHVDEVYFLGDLCEAWVGDDDDSPLALALADALHAAALRTQLCFMAGNRDFLLGAGFAAAAGIRLIDDPHLLPGGTLLAHGDAFCTDDAPYQEARALVRSAPWQAEILARSLPDRRQLAAALREQSRATNANKPENIMDVNPAAVARAATERGATTLIHGHTHRPGIHRETWGTRYVLGAWERCAWLILEDRGQFRLECRPFAW
jgi:UDP-2,3-diacylglucosamine hydrolase